MKKEKRLYKLFLEDIQIAMERIAEYINGYSFDGFKKDSKPVDAVIRNFEIIGEAAKSLPDGIKKNMLRCHGKKCICCEIRFHTNILVLTMKLFGTLPPTIYPKTNHR